ncbi:Nucleic acid-binding, OB-fold [Sesbania bispinosa]|nr:Nucleic acid-binding, OB-fold [Sesbania bispinosa]
MAAMCGRFIPIREISPDPPLWVITTQLIRLWTSPVCNDFSCVQSVEMVFMDTEEDKVQVSISKELLMRKKPVMVEGGMYKISHVSIIPNDSKDKPTRHPFRLAINQQSQVINVDSVGFSSFGLSPLNTRDIVVRKHDTNFLVDKVGLLTLLSCQREYISEHKDVAAVYMEITDPSGTVECVLYDDYVEDLLQFLHTHGPCTPVIVIQFAKIVPDAQVMFDGKIQYQHLDMPCLSLRDEFFLYHPHKEVGDLHQTQQGGVFVVCAKITDILEDEVWWYSDCKPRTCSRKGPALYSCDGSYAIVPRYNVKVEISDSNDSTYLSLGDDAVHKLLKEPHTTKLPHIFNTLIGKRMLFLVKKKAAHHLQEGCFRMKRVCDDKELVRMFFKGHFFRADRKPKATVARMLGEPRNTQQFHHEQGSSFVGPMRYDGPSSSAGSLSIKKGGTMFGSNTDEHTFVDKHCVYFPQTSPQNDG